MYTEIENDAFDSANEALLFCKSYLEEKGQAEAASYLEGLSQINDEVMGRLAISRLKLAHDLVRNAEGRHLLTLAVNALQRALAIPVLLAAS